MKRYATRRPSLDNRWHECSVVKVVRLIEQSGRNAQECWETLDAGGILALGDLHIARQQTATEQADSFQQASFIDTEPRPGPQPVRQLKLL